MKMAKTIEPIGRQTEQQRKAIEHVGYQNCKRGKRNLLNKLNYENDRYIWLWCLPVMEVNQKIRSYPVIENIHKEFDDPWCFLRICNAFL